MEALSVIRDKTRAGVLLQGDRQHLLTLLREPQSASALARELDIPRQKVNYHLRELEKVGLIELVEERRARNCMERIVQATARAYIISPEILASLGEDPGERCDRFSSNYLLSMAARTIREVGELREAADKAGKKLGTLSLETEVRFATAADRNAFAEELTTAIASLAAKYHNEEAPRGRVFRLHAGMHPELKTKDKTMESGKKEQSS